MNEILKFYKIINDGEWANIFVRVGENKLPCNSKNWLEITINSSFGLYAHYWANPDDDVFDFLIDSINSKHYFLNKFGGENYYIFDANEAVRYLKERVINYRREGGRKAESRKYFNEILDITETDKALFFHYLIQTDLWNKLDIWEETKYFKIVNPKLLLFWDKLWLPFVGELKKEKLKNNA